MCKKIISYGFNDNDYKIINYTLSKELTIFKYLYRNRTYQIKTKQIGISNMYIILSLLITLSKLGLSYHKITNTLKEINIPFHMESIRYNNSYIIINRASSLDDVKNIIKDVKYYHYNNIYCMINKYDIDINNYLNYHINYLYDYKEKNKQHVLKELLKKLGTNDVLLILELDNIKDMINA